MRYYFAYYLSFHFEWTNLSLQKLHVLKLIFSSLSNCIWWPANENFELNNPSYVWSSKYWKKYFLNDLNIVDLKTLTCETSTNLSRYIQNNFASHCVLMFWIFSFIHIIKKKWIFCLISFKTLWWLCS
jgi:hypothetical protein